MRNLINIVEALEDDLTRVRNYLKKEYWICFEKTNTEFGELEVWKHMDDPRIGAYMIISRNNKIQQLRYLSTLSAIFNRSFETLGQFIHHVSTITNDDLSDEGMQQGREKLADIAKKLRQQKKDKED